jgi:hypothetical protein
LHKMALFDPSHARAPVLCRRVSFEDSRRNRAGDEARAYRSARNGPRGAPGGGPSGRSAPPSSA